MNRSEAVSIYKEIASLSEEIGYRTFNLKWSEKSDPIAQNYQLRIMMLADPVTKQQIMSIARKHNLGVKIENGEVIVYKPK